MPGALETTAGALKPLRHGKYKALPGVGVHYGCRLAKRGLTTDIVGSGSGKDIVECHGLVLRTHSSVEVRKRWLKSALLWMSYMRGELSCLDDVELVKESLKVTLFVLNFLASCLTERNRSGIVDCCCRLKCCRSKLFRHIIRFCWTRGILKILSDISTTTVAQLPAVLLMLSNL